MRRIHLLGSKKSLSNDDLVCGSSFPIYQKLFTGVEEPPAARRHCYLSKITELKQVDPGYHGCASS